MTMRLVQEDVAVMRRWVIFLHPQTQSVWGLKTTELSA